MAVECRNGALAVLITGADCDTLTLVAVGENGRLLDTHCQLSRPGNPTPPLEVKGERLQLSDKTGLGPLTIWNEGKFTASDVAHQYSAVALYRATKELDSEPIVVYQDAKGSIVTQKLADSGWDARGYYYPETNWSFSDPTCPLAQILIPSDGDHCAYIGTSLAIAVDPLAAEYTVYLS